MELFKLIEIINLDKTLLFITNLTFMFLFLIIIFILLLNTYGNKIENSFINFVNSCSVLYLLKFLIYGYIMKHVAVWGDEFIPFNILDVAMERYFLNVFFFIIVINFVRSVLKKILTHVFFKDKININSIDSFLMKFISLILIILIFLLVYFSLLDIFTVIRLLQKLIL